MAFITLYSFYKPGVGIGVPGELIAVITDDANPFYINFTTTLSGGGPTQPPEGTIISVKCQGTTQYTYKVKTALSYATVTALENSTYCGYTPPTCDIFEKSFSKTDETNVGANDGTGNMFAVSSFTPITYFLFHPLEIASNTIGLFTGLEPGDYTIKAVDTNSCTVEQSFTIKAYDPSLTRCKYRLQFTSLLNQDIYRLDFLDQKHQYDPDIYPLYLTGTNSPLIKTTANQSEDKTEPILATTLDINLINNAIFQVDEFAKADERTWFMQLFKNEVLDFQGWLLPDQAQDQYADPIYPIALTATDGLASLKGAQFGDPAIFTYDSDMNKIYTQLYGLKGWSYLVKICLDWLNYDYGNTTVVSSLQNGGYDEQFWANVSTWGDNYYDSSGTPLDVYTALSNLLKSEKLTILQHKGQFILVNWNDLWYINRNLQYADYVLAFYKFNAAMSAIILSGVGNPMPSILQIGYGKIGEPINPMQSINYDLSYGIMKAQIDFNILALLYENPSFEIGAVQGDLPVDYNHVVGTVNAYINYNPVTTVIGSGAYDGQWELKVNPIPIAYGTDNFFENNSPFFTIDQSNKLLNISFVWKVPPCTNTTPSPMGYVFSFVPVFIDGTSGNAYFLKIPDVKSLSYQDLLVNSNTPANPAAQPLWEHLNDTYYTEGDACGIKGVPTTDYIGWQSYSFVAPIFPESQIGTLSVRFYSVKAQLYDTSRYVIPPLGGDPTTVKNSLYIDVDAGDSGYYLIDDLNITLSDASTATNLQIGETHTITNVTNFAKSETKQLDLTLFTFPPNKRLAGQFMYGLTYDTAVTFDSLKFNLQTTAKVGKLPYAIINSWGRTYQRPMYIFEGDLSCDNVPFYGVFSLDGYNDVLFIPFSVSADLRNSVVHVIIVEFDDSDAQVIYSYKANYQKNARSNA